MLESAHHTKLFLAQLQQYDQNNEQGQHNQNILELLRDYAHEDLISLFNLSEKNERVKKYCYLKDKTFEDFWNGCLVNPIILEHFYIHPAIQHLSLQPQALVHGLDLLKGLFWFNAAYKKYEKHKTEFFHLRQFLDCLVESINYHFCFAGSLLLRAYLDQGQLDGDKENNPLTFHRVEENLKELAVYNGSAGYFLLAQLYFNQKEYGDHRYYYALAQLEKAQLFIDQSQAEINNTGCQIIEFKNSLDSLNKMILRALKVIEIPRPQLRITGLDDQSCIPTAPS